MHALRLISPFALGLVACLAGTGQAGAGTLVFDPTTSPCTTPNCSSESLNGTYGPLGGSALPWTIQIFAVPSRCLRVEVTEETIDLEAVLVSPDGTTFRNDDSGGTCNRCPLIKVGSTPSQGWYTLQISHFNATTVFSNFTLRYGLYPTGNPNCASPTTGQSSRARAKSAGLDASDTFDPFDLDAPPSE